MTIWDESCHGREGLKQGVRVLCSQLPYYASYCEKWQGKKGEVKHQPVKVSIFTKNKRLFYFIYNCEFMSTHTLGSGWIHIVSFPARQANEYCLSRHFFFFHFFYCGAKTIYLHPWTNFYSYVQMHSVTLSSTLCSLHFVTMEHQCFRGVFLFLMGQSAFLYRFGCAALSGEVL